MLNLVPCFALDGQYILAALLSVNKKDTNQFINNNETKKPVVYIILMMLGTLLLIINLILSLLSLFSTKFGSYFRG